MCAVRNRANQTLQSVGQLHSALSAVKGISANIVIVDDASTDETVDRLKRHYPSVQTIVGTGDDYWAGGMRRGFVEKWNSEYSHLLVFNDDSNFIPTALDAFFRSLLDNMNNGCILVGAFTSGQNKAVTYGVQKYKRKWLSYSFERVAISEKWQQGVTLNMNFALIPRNVIDSVGFLDKCFTHSMADFDYGLRAFQKGFKVCQIPNVIGYCERNSIANTWLDASLNIGARLLLLHSVKGYPPRERWYLLSRHAGLMAPVYFAYPYVKILLESLRR